jgi:hypothetical protein
MCKESLGFLYVGCHQLLHHLTDMHQKPSAYFGLCVGMVPIVYHCLCHPSAAIIVITTAAVSIIT